MPPVDRPMTVPSGNEAARAAFYGAARGPSMHHAWLIAGPEGLGKGSFARDAARHLLVSAADPTVPLDPEEPIASHPIAAQIAAGAHPDYRVLQRLPKDAAKPDQDLARSITIAQVRGLQPLFATKPSHSPRRIVVIDAIDDCERPAANALLKNLEEPPTGTIFLLVSHAPGQLLPTIRSRCRVLRFEPLSDPQVANIVGAAVPDANADEVAALVRAGRGSPGRAIAYAGLDLAAIEEAIERIARTGDRDNAGRIALGKALSGKAAQQRYEAFLDRVPSFIADHARSVRGAALRDALDAYAAARDLARTTLRQSLEPATTVFEMGSLLARLAN